MTDNDILKYFYYKYGNKLRLSTKKLIDIPDIYISYLNKRFNDSESIYESIVRIYHKIEIRPICKICGKSLHFTELPNIPFRKTCSNNCHNKLAILSMNNTINEKYGVSNISQLESIKIKKQQTCLNHYGVDNPLKNNDIKNKVKEKLKLQQKEIHNKIKETCLKKYGVDNTSKVDEIKQKIKNTFINKYGVDNPMKCDEIKNKFNWDSMIINQIKSKRKNNTFNKSKLEDLSYDLLKEKYIDIIRQYRSELYPFNCDFYIPSLDLYIECNYGWTHCDHPFNENNKEDQLILKSWEDKNTNYYNNAINTWTIRDVNKRNIAKQNNLNYIEFWNINELKNWLNNY